jgi:uncharacterized protein (TIGR00251 family)
MTAILPGSELSGFLKIRVTPRAKTNEISEIFPDGTVKIRLTAPPVDRKANKALTKFLSSILKIPQSEVEIISGSTGRKKIIRVNGFDQKSLDARIKEIV